MLLNGFLLFSGSGGVTQVQVYDEIDIQLESETEVILEEEIEVTLEEDEMVIEECY